jgi:hypothetical protein
VDDRVGHLRGLQVLEAERLAGAGAELGVDHEGHHVAELDRRAVDVQLAAHRLGEADHRVLGGRVGRAAGRAVLAGLRGDVHDVTAVAGHHPREDDLHAEHDAVDVDVDQPGRGRVVLLDEAPQRHDPRVVDEHVDRAQALLDGVDERLEGVAPGHVEREALRVGADLGGGLAGEVDVEIADRDRHALAHEGLRGRLADAARGTGDRRYLPDEDAGLLCHPGDSPPAPAQQR